VRFLHKTGLNIALVLILPPISPAAWNFGDFPEPNSIEAAPILHFFHFPSQCSHSIPLAVDDSRLAKFPSFS
jgi:hypothetical protein